MRRGTAMPCRAVPAGPDLLTETLNTRLYSSVIMPPVCRIPSVHADRASDDRDGFSSQRDQLLAASDSPDCSEIQTIWRKVIRSNSIILQVQNSRKLPSRGRCRKCVPDSVYISVHFSAKISRVYQRWHARLQRELCRLMNSVNSSPSFTAMFYGVSFAEPRSSFEVIAYENEHSR